MKQESPYIVCYCYTVSDDWIKSIILKHDCKTYHDVQKHCPVGTKCGACVGDIQDLCEKANEKG
jgi:bacterioferritin-associated ferredoxin